MITIIFLATAFSTAHGGINAFNEELCLAVAKGAGAARRIICIVPATDEKVRIGVRHSHLCLLITGSTTLSWPSIQCCLKSKLDTSISGAATWWVGHDVITGPVALECAKQTKSRVALIHHTNYGAYAHFKYGGAKGNHANEQQQASMFQQADCLFAVGPLLAGSLKRLCHRHSIPQFELVPGLPDGVTPMDEPPQPFRAIVFGRMGGNDDPIKQGRLAVAGLAAAVGQAVERKSQNLLAGLRPEIRIFGIEDVDGTMFRGIQSLARNYSNGVWPSPSLEAYTTDRDRLWTDLEIAHVAVMPSWHEGFGLAGWEAIAAEVPLLISRDSGLYQLVYRAGAHLVDDLSTFPVQGRLSDDGEPFTSADVEAVASAFTAVAENYSVWKSRAKRLRRELSHYTWEKTAISFEIALKSVGENSFQQALTDDRTFQQLNFQVEHNDWSPCFNRIRDLLTLNLDNARNVRRLEHLPELQSLTNSSLYTKNADLDVLKSVRDGTELLSIYSELPIGRGSGYIIKEWLKKNMAVKMIQIAVDHLSNFIKTGDVAR